MADQPSEGADVTGDAGPVRRRVRLRRFPMADVTEDDGRLAADLERVFDTYGLQGFEYRTWGRWQAAVSTGPGVAAHAHRSGETMSKNTSRPGGPYAWEMPDDLKGGSLPLLRRMPDTSSLVSQLKLEASPVVSVDEGRAQGGLPELREAAQDLSAPPAPRASADKTAEKKQGSDARSRLRQLALKGQTHG